MAKDLVDKRVNFVGLRLSDRERADLDALRCAYAIGDSSIIRAALQLLAQVTVGAQGR